jgi:hypothetical protein
MTHWRETACRVTKYNPKNRDEKGAYQVDEWTSISDIGKEFNRIRFTFQEYISVENKYILSILEFCTYFGIEEFEIKNLELHDPNIWDEYSMDLKGTYERVKNKNLISNADIQNLARLILREYLWCDLENNGKGIHFGYDYYMYFDTGKTIPEELKARIEIIGLYVD